MPELSEAVRRAGAGEADMLRETVRAYGRAEAAEHKGVAAREGPGPDDIAIKGRA